MSEQTKVEDGKPQAVPPELQGKSLLPAEPSAGAAVAEARGKEETGRYPDPATATGFATDEHGYIRDYIALADQKAGSLFTILAAMLAYLQVQGATRRWLMPVSTWKLLDVLACIAVLGLLAGAVLALLVVIPRIGGSKQGLVFWEAVAAFTNAEDYAEQVVAAEPRRLLRAKLEHCFELATVCRRKYWMLTRALWCGGSGLIASLLYLARA